MKPSTATSREGNRLLFKIGCAATAAGLICSKFPQTQEFVLIFGIIGFGLLVGDAIAHIFGEGS